MANRYDSHRGYGLADNSRLCTNKERVGHASTDGVPAMKGEIVIRVLKTLTLMTVLLAMALPAIAKPHPECDPTHRGPIPPGHQKHGDKFCETPLPPETTIDNIDTSNVGSDGSIVAQFSSSEANSTFECKLLPLNELGEETVQPIWVPCSSPETYENLGWFSYRLYVRATDAAGNVDETPATQVFEAKVDSIPPDGEITDGPADGAVLNQSSVTYSFQVSDNREIQNTGCVIYDNATGFPYRLPTDDPNGLPSGEKRVCSSPVTFENIPDGNYTFTLYPQDKTFTTDPTPATRTFTVDTTVP